FVARVLDLRVRLDPIQAAAHAGPEAVGIAYRFLIEPLVVGLAQMSERGEVLGYFVDLSGHGGSIDQCRENCGYVRSRAVHASARRRRVPPRASCGRQPPDFGVGW